MEKENIRQIVNLYDGSFKTKYALSFWEKNLFLKTTLDKNGRFGHYTQIKDFDYDLEERGPKGFMEDVINIIAQIAQFPAMHLSIATVECIGPELSSELCKNVSTDQKIKAKIRNLLPKLFTMNTSAIQPIKMKKRRAVIISKI